ncbi:hypothetical protein B0H19DRAFT_1269110 [Mycena capillaripes]|nr:hypothetical protein B0H19DRAFT_1269110 [Mycena capillaripes]
MALENHAHDWITVEDFVHWRDRLCEELQPIGTGNVSIAEFARHEITVVTQGGDVVVALVGRADAVVETGDRVEVIKCANLLTMADKVQAAEYGYLYACQRGLTALPPTILYNLLDGEKIQIEAEVERVTAMNRKLLREKYKPVPVGDEAFLKDCFEIRATHEQTALHLSAFPHLSHWHVVLQRTASTCIQTTTSTIATPHHILTTVFLCHGFDNATVLLSTSRNWKQRICVSRYLGICDSASVCPGKAHCAERGELVTGSNIEGGNIEVVLNIVLSAICV